MLVCRALVRPPALPAQARLPLRERLPAARAVLRPGLEQLGELAFGARMFGGGAVQPTVGGDNLLGGPSALKLGRLVQGHEPPTFPDRGLQCRVGLLPPLGCRMVFTLLLLVHGADTGRVGQRPAVPQLLERCQRGAGRPVPRRRFGGVLLQAGQVLVPQAEEDLQRQDPCLVLPAAEELRGDRVLL